MTERIFALPDLGEGLEEGRVLRWLVHEGDVVALNRPIVEIETAKAAVEIPSPFAGHVARLHAVEGDDVRVGAPLVTFEVDGPAAERPHPTTVEAPGGSPPSRAPTATPAVRRLAKDLGVDLAPVVGTGTSGRITVDDVRAVARAHGAPTDAGGDHDVPISPTRRAIAETLTRAITEVPQVTTFRTVDASALEAVRRDLRLSPLPIIVKALAETCREHSALNASYLPGEGVIRTYGRCDVGVAVQTESGLVVPVVRDAWTASIAEIASEIARVSDAARSGRLAPADLRGATVSVSNYGSYGSEAGTPILVPPQGAILGIGVIALRPAVVAGEVVARPSCTLSLTFDHRLLDGHVVGDALSDLVDRLQSIERLRDLPR